MVAGEPAPLHVSAPLVHCELSCVHAGTPVSTQLAGQSVQRVLDAWRPPSRSSESATVRRVMSSDDARSALNYMLHSLFWAKALDGLNEGRATCRFVLVTLARQVCMIVGVAA